MTFSYDRRIFLCETDATGALYFSELLKLGLEALESFFSSKGFTLQKMLDEQAFLLPIVHAEGDFFSPLRVGDLVRIDLSLSSIGNTSFTVATEVFYAPSNRRAGSTKIVHVAVDKETGKSIAVPSIILDQFASL